MLGDAGRDRFVAAALALAEYIKRRMTAAVGLLRSELLRGTRHVAGLFEYVLVWGVQVSVSNAWGSWDSGASWPVMAE